MIMLSSTGPIALIFASSRNLLRTLLQTTSGYQSSQASMERVAHKRSRTVSQRPSSDTCRTCRARRVRCDATRPSCLNCIKSKRRCEGYAIWSVAFRLPGESMTSSAEEDSNTELITRRPSEGLEPQLAYDFTWRPRMVQRTDVLSSNAMRFALDYYRHVGIHSQTQLSNSPTAVVVGMKYAIFYIADSPVWPHILAALGGAWQARVKVTHATTSQMLDMEKYDTAHQIFSRALFHVQHWTNTVQQNNIEPLIVALLLLFGFELATGNHMMSLHYLRNIKAVVQAHPFWIANLTRPGTPLGDMLRGSASRLEDRTMPHRSGPTPNNAKSFDDRTTIILANIANNQKQTFNSMDGAIDYLEGLLDSSRKIELELQRCGQEFIRRLDLDISISLIQQRCLECCMRRSAPIGNAVIERINDTLRGYQYWQTAFGVHRLQKRQDSAALFLQLRAFCSYFCAAMCRETEEERCDRFITDFVKMTGLAADYLNLRKPQTLQPGCDIPPTGTHAQSNILEWGVLQVLYIICLKCRDPVSRRRCLRLLSDARRKEGTVESETFAVYAKAIINLEEKQAGGSMSEAFALPGLFSDSIPEAARFCDVVACSRTSDGESFELVCGRYLPSASNHLLELTTYYYIPAYTKGVMAGVDGFLSEAKIIEISTDGRSHRVWHKARP